MSGSCLQCREIQMSGSSKLLAISLVLALLSHGTCTYNKPGWDDDCPASRCSKDGPEIRFPHRLESSNTSSACGASCARLACSGQDTILHHPFLGPCKVTSKDYKKAVMKIIPLQFTMSPCPLPKPVFDSLPPYGIYSCDLYSRVPDITGAAVRSFVAFDDRSVDTGGDMWKPFYKLARSSVKVISATSSVAAFVVLSFIMATALYLSLKSKYDEDVHLKVEMFLRTYGTLKPTRYSFSDVKKITRRFKEQLGQGGFGSVYKGELPNGVPVAVKMIEHCTGEGEEFINEVATIGQIHHINIVRLLGFCSDGTRQILIYEFMPNESLEKYIFLHDPDTSQESLAPNKMLEIALGIARGMEYLHQGCNQRILHFDIKPHNILLDYNFNPKISDFGLAKLCARDQSIVTLTKARGTMGYIAPELYSRNFGEISYKSDVYSFGMLVLEMVSGRRNSDPSIENQNEAYFPELIHEKVITGQDLVFGREMTEEERLKVRQMALVALWCIQWNPRNRPSMTKVVNMLTGRLQNIQVPPKPFVSYESHHVP